MSRLIQLNRVRGSKYGEMHAVVDESDYAELSRFNWTANRSGRTFYAARSIVRSNGRWSIERMHRLILPDAPEVDHINGDGLDNRRANLRPATRSENVKNCRRRTDNTSGFVGVTWRADRGKWRAYVRLNGHSRHLGLYATPEEAAVARDLAAIELHGAYAKLNFPEVTP